MSTGFSQDLAGGSAPRSAGSDYVAAYPEATEGDFAMIEASDTGEGITAETASQAFGPFFTTQRNPAKGSALAA